MVSNLSGESYIVFRGLLFNLREQRAKNATHELGWVTITPDDGILFDQELMDSLHISRIMGQVLH